MRKTALGRARNAERDVQVIQRFAGHRVFFREVLAEGLGERGAYGTGFPASRGTAAEPRGGVPGRGEGGLSGKSEVVENRAHQLRANYITHN